MRIQILGSAAAEAVPALWCECDYCKFARENKGKDLRRRTSYWIDSDILVDFGPDAYWQSNEFGIDLTKIKAICFSHSHEDHLDPVELQWRRKGFSKVGSQLKVFGPAGVFRRITTEIADLETLHIDGTEVIEFQSYQIDENTTIIPMKASHIANELCVNYIIKRGDKSILIANDTGWWSDESWDFIKDMQLDAAIIECTFAFYLGEEGMNYRDGHLGAMASKEFSDKLKSINALKPDAKVAVNHYSHNGAPYQSKMEEFFDQYNIEVGFDGKVIEL